MSRLEIKERRAGNVIILDIGGHLTIGESNVALEKTIHRLLGEGQQKILLNLADVSYIDSSGLGELISSRVAVNREGGQIKLLHLTHSLCELMMITKLLTVFDVYESESEAVTSFKPRPKGRQTATN